MRVHPDPEAAARELKKYFELCEISRGLALAGIRYRHPNATEAEIRTRWQEQLQWAREEKWKNA